MIQPLLYARSGVQKTFFFLSYDVDANNPQQYSSSGLLNRDENYSRKPAADYVYQTNKLFSEYTYWQTLNTDPIVDKYRSGNKAMYMLVVPDQKNRTAGYQLNTGTPSVLIYTPAPGQDNMTVKKVNTVKGVVTISVTETPVFVTPAN